MWSFPFCVLAAYTLYAVFASPYIPIHLKQLSSSNSSMQLLFSHTDANSHTVTSVCPPMSRLLSHTNNDNNQNSSKFIKSYMYRQIPYLQPISYE